MVYSVYCTTRLRPKKIGMKVFIPPSSSHLNRFTVVNDLVFLFLTTSKFNDQVDLSKQTSSQQYSVCELYAI